MFKFKLIKQLDSLSTISLRRPLKRFASTQLVPFFNRANIGAIIKWNELCRCESFQCTLSFNYHTSVNNPFLDKAPIIAFHVIKFRVISNSIGSKMVVASSTNPCLAYMVMSALFTASSAFTPVLMR